MQKLTNLGVINFADYPQQDIAIKGNAVVIKASNGTGKTLLMTALYPALLTLELQKSLNMGQKTNRKLSDLLNLRLKSVCATVTVALKNSLTARLLSKVLPLKSMAINASSSLEKTSAQLSLS